MQYLKKASKSPATGEDETRATVAGMLHDIEAGGEARDNAVWTYETPLDNVTDMKDLVSFYWLEMDQWMEEDEVIDDITIVIVYFN